MDQIASSPTSLGADVGAPPPRSARCCPSWPPLPVLHCHFHRANPSGPSPHPGELRQRRVPSLSSQQLQLRLPHGSARRRPPHTNPPVALGPAPPASGSGDGAPSRPPLTCGGAPSRPRHYRRWRPIQPSRHHDGPSSARVNAMAERSSLWPSRKDEPDEPPSGLGPPPGRSPSGRNRPSPAARLL